MIVKNKASVRDILIMVFADKGFKLNEESNLLSLEYKGQSCFVMPDEDSRTFSFSQIICGVGDDNLSKAEFDVVIDIVKSKYDGFDYMWEEYLSFVSSYAYDIHNFEYVTEEQLREMIEEFFEMWQCAFDKASMVRKCFLSLPPK